MSELSEPPGISSVEFERDSSLDSDEQNGPSLNNDRLQTCRERRTDRRKRTMKRSRKRHCGCTVTKLISKSPEEREKHLRKFRLFARKRFRRMKLAIKNKLQGNSNTGRAREVTRSENNRVPTQSEVEKWCLRQLVVLVERIDVAEAIKKVKSLSRTKSEGLE